MENRHSPKRTNLTGGRKQNPVLSRLMVIIVYDNLEMTSNTGAKKERPPYYGSAERWRARRVTYSLDAFTQTLSTLRPASGICEDIDFVRRS
jgi:hypothetical protein